MSDQVVDHIKSSPSSNAGVDDLTDEDIRQLIIHHATIIRSQHGSYSDRRKRDQVVINAWKSWPENLRERFRSMVLDAGADGAFWTRPADTNNRLTPGA